MADGPLDVATVEAALAEFKDPETGALPCIWTRFAISN